MRESADERKINAFSKLLLFMIPSTKKQAININTSTKRASQKNP